MFRKIIFCLFIGLSMIINACTSTDQPKVQFKNSTKTVVKEHSSKVASSTPKQKDGSPKKITPKHLKKVIFNTTDGVKVYANYYFPKYNRSEGNPSLPIAILLHMEGSSKESFKPLAEKLCDKGIAVLALDFRGHGQSVKTIDGESFSKYDMQWENILIDIDAAIAFLQKDKHVNINNISLIGAKIGANAAIIISTDYPHMVKKVVAISPVINNRGLSIDDRISRSNSDIMLIATKNDEKSSQDIDKLKLLATGTCIVKKYEAGGQGTQLFVYVPESMKDIQAFIIPE